MKTNRIIAVHLLNDFSGSPFVLRQALEALISGGYRVELFTATPGEKGFLSNIAGANTHTIFYKWSPNKLVTLFYFILGQLSVFSKLLFFLKKNDIVYVNSLLPFGAAIAAKMRGCKVVCHFHEVSIKPVLLKNMLLFFANATATKGIFVSQFLLDTIPFNKPKQLVYNSLPQQFINNVAQRKITDKPFTVLMACSLKKYKGIEQFILVAKLLPHYQFNLVLNATQAEVGAFIATQAIAANTTLYAAQANMHGFYADADVVMNLSLPGQWIETFGMTILEAMYYQKPVIIPTVGGITELVTDGVEGYRINSEETLALATKIKCMAEDKALYAALSANASAKAQQFTPANFSHEIIQLFSTVKNKPNQLVTTQHFNYEKATTSGNRHGRHTGQLRRI